MSDDKFVTDYRLQSLLSGNGWIPGKEISSSGGGATTYTQLTDAATVSLPSINTPLSTALTTLSTSISGKQNTLTAGNNITLNGNTISATSGATTYVQLTDHETVDLTNVNSPLFNKLGAIETEISDLQNGKQDNLVGGNQISIDLGAINVVTNPSFNTTSIQTLSFFQGNGSLDYYETSEEELGFTNTGTSETYTFLFARLGKTVTMTCVDSIVFTSASGNTITASIPASMAPSPNPLYFTVRNDTGVADAPFTLFTACVDVNTTLSLGVEGFGSNPAVEFKIMPFSFTYIIQ